MSESNIDSDDRFCDSALLAFSRHQQEDEMSKSTISRRALMAGTAALATGAGATNVTPAKAAAPDPIFTLIEQFRVAFAHRESIRGSVLDPKAALSPSVRRGWSLASQGAGS
jgi:hypothetical protein